MEQFASGWKRNYYGKGDVIVYRLNRNNAPSAAASPVFGANVLMLVYGDAFWPTYTTGDNTGLVATDSMKNFIQRETLSFEGPDLENYCRFLGAKFISSYPQVEGVQVTATEIPYSSLAAGGVAFTPSGRERARARIELSRAGVVEIASGLLGYKLLRLGGSAFEGFVRDQYTTLPDIHDRPLHMWMDVEWIYTEPSLAFSGGAISTAVRKTIREVFDAFESGSIQQVIYKMGTRILSEQPSIAEIHLEANNRTWDTVIERGQEVGVFTDARPPYGCLGLRLRR
jgi:urate oxidase/2-oxo-4-hydroxy-4-carboxy-5-ureidoimidazoline decarboxylase